MSALLGNLRHGNTHIFDSKPSLLFLSLSKKVKLTFLPHQVSDILNSVI